MEEKIAEKISEIVGYIIEKPVEEITRDEYTMLQDELKNLKYRRETEISNERFRKLMEISFPVSGFGSRA